MAKYYPVNLDLENKQCIVIGGGNVAQRKVKRLLECKAQVKVISPQITPKLKILAKNKKIIWKKKKAIRQDVQNSYLVVCAANSHRVNDDISFYCLHKKILVNVVDAAGQSSFIVPSLLKRGNFNIAISTDGISPALSRKIRLDLEKKFGEEYAVFLQIMKQLRSEVIKKITNPKKKKKIFEKMARSRAISQIKSGKVNLAKKTLISILKKEYDV